MKSLNPVFVIFAIFFVCLVVFMFGKPTQDSLLGSDFLNNFVAATIVKNGDGNKLYDINFNYQVQEEIIKRIDIRNRNSFRLIPASTIIFLPFVWLSSLVAFKYFVLFNFIILGIIATWSLKTFKNLSKNKPYLTLIVLIYLPILLALTMGQTSIILTILYLSSFSSIKRKKWFLAGFLSSFLLLKIQYITLVPFLFLISKDKAVYIKGFLISLILLLGTSLYISGWETLLKYPSYVLSSETVEFGSDAVVSFTFYGFLLTQNLFKNLSREFLIAANLVFYLITLFSFWYSYKGVSLEKSFISATLLSVFFSMHSLAYDLALIFVPILIIGNSLLSKPRMEINIHFFIGSLLFFLPTVIYLESTYNFQFFFLILGFFYLVPESNFFLRKILLRSGVVKSKIFTNERD